MHNTLAMTTAVCWTGRLLSSIGTAAEGCKRGSCQHNQRVGGLVHAWIQWARLVAARSSAWSLVRFGLDAFPVVPWSSRELIM